MRMVPILIAALVVLAMPMVWADVTPTGANTTAGTADSATTSTETNQSINAGQVLEVNLSVTSNTKYWAGFYGKISESIVLGSGSTYMMSWNVTTPTGYVYLVYNTTTVNWASLDGVQSETNIVNAGIWSSAPTGADSFTETFSDPGANETNYCGADYTTNPYVTLTQGDFDGDGTPGAEWPTCILKDDANVIVLKAKISSATNRAGFKGTEVDYQALVPASTGGSTYYFYKA